MSTYISYIYIHEKGVILNHAQLPMEPFLLSHCQVGLLFVVEKSRNVARIAAGVGPEDSQRLPWFFDS